MIKSYIKIAAEKTFGESKPYNKKNWFIQEIVTKIREKRIIENSSNPECHRRYRAVRNKINRACKAARQRFFEVKCREVEILPTNNNMDSA